MQTFALQEVKLKNGVFKNAQDVDLKYILALNPDKLLAPYLIDAGLPLKAERYGNWESSGLDGHIGGHYLSALAMMYASTGNAELKQRLEYMIAELARCQAKNGNGYVGGIPQGKVFWERIHKGDIDGSGFGLNNRHGSRGRRLAGQGQILCFSRAAVRATGVRGGHRDLKLILKKEGV